MVYTNLLFGVSPYGKEFDDENVARGLEYTTSNPMLDIDFDNSHDDKCACDECKVHGHERYECHLCHRDAMTKQAAECHCHEDTHKDNLSELDREQSEAIDIMGRWNIVHEATAC
jgi:hypothetical protein